MAETRTVVSGLWVAVMLTYLWGDVLRVYAGHVEPGKVNGVTMGPGGWLGIAALMLVPIVMLVLSLTVRYPEIRWINIGVAVVVILFNIVGLPYKGAYDNFLIGVSIVFNALTVWYAWNWSG